MCIAEAVTQLEYWLQGKFRLQIWLLLSWSFAACCLSPAVWAHPVSQGSMSITLLQDRIEILARVSQEELWVAEALGSAQSRGRLEAIRRHADYILAHLHIHAEGRPLIGRTLELPQKPAAFLPYRFEYPLEDAESRRIEMRQDLLREFDFAPGNAWEASYIVRIISRGEQTAEGLLFSFREPLIIQGDELAGMGLSRQAVAFIRHGVTHILTGYDHLLFVGALLLAAAGWWDLVKVITAFTLAHSLTLALSALNVLRLPSSIVEPMIAFSIVAAALQNLLGPRQCRGWQRLLLAFGFGLFHGLGFAGGLLDAMAEMPLRSALFAIAAFSLGVELGHQMVVLPAFYGLTQLRRSNQKQSHHAQHYGSALISLCGLVYLYASFR
ncbi:MAG: HupE/UreJ family protein [Methylococcaceae bacterium]|nr:HupE/UreJ family protein [Methylococcaceae bacterium]